MPNTTTTTNPTARTERQACLPVCAKTRLVSVARCDSCTPLELPAALASAVREFADHELPGAIYILGMRQAAEQRQEERSNQRS